MDGADSFAQLEEAIGYRFSDQRLLSQALTHSSRKPELRCSNERLEFLGDAILGAAISDYLYRRFPEYSEGNLTRLKSVVVSRSALARAAREMNLGKYLLVAKGVANLPGEAEEGLGEGGERTRTTAAEAPQRGRATLPPSILADGFEALLGAVYLDGGPDAAREFVLRHLRSEMERATEELPAQDAKSVLQELVQREMGATPVYKVTAETGPDHVKTFEVVTLVAGQPYGSGRGTTKKAAEQKAAELTLAMLRRRNADGENKPSPTSADETEADPAPDGPS